MASVFQIPIFVADSWFVLLIYGTVVAAVLGAATFIWFYFRRNLNQVGAKVNRLETKVKEIEGPWPEANEIRERVLHMEDYLQHFSKGVEKELSHLQSHVLSEGESGMRNLRKDLLSKLTDGLTHNEMKVSRLSAGLSELRREIGSQAKESKKSAKKTSKRFKEIMGMYMFMMLEELRDVKDEDTVDMRLRNIRTFRSFARKQRWWDKKMQENLLDTMRDMERKSGGLSPLYSMFIDEIRKS